MSVDEMERMARLTCASAVDSRLYAGDADGRVHCFDACVVGASVDRAQQRRWTARAAFDAITSICVVRKADEKVVIAAGTTTGAVIIFRDHVQERRLQVDSAVVSITAAAGDGEFLVGDLHGSLYGVNLYEVVWKTRLPASTSSSTPFITTSQTPCVRAMQSVCMLDVEKTASSYVLIAAGQNELLVTHRGRTFGSIPTPSPVSAILCVRSASPDLEMEEANPMDGKKTHKGKQAPVEDLVLVGGLDGIVSHVFPVREPADNHTAFRFAVEPWARVSFPVAKLVSVRTDLQSGGLDDVKWLCLGVNGELAYFFGKKQVREWSSVQGRVGAQDDHDRVPFDLLVLPGSTTKGPVVAIITGQSIKRVPLDEEVVEAMDMTS
ncbi:hypothetical protein Poli38472_008575 [Pythium oligandrum]|uniref:Uncharacterized protein n=1 Tax=Pythium oligandrum TaxID=41045 RepID=A0A8K1C3R8_PYTOL|nr:hypothetical protein Poli38472_008575 [Pythium oligandrum]|eukprot:TMW55927.1 hypothetical protein Poli38472_008575 [Pythium oligandrum]